MNFSFTVTFGDLLMLGTILGAAWKINNAWTKIIVEHGLMWNEYRQRQHMNTRRDDEQV